MESDPLGPTTRQTFAPGILRSPDEDRATAGALRQGIDPLRAHELPPLDSVQGPVDPHLLMTVGRAGAGSGGQFVRIASLTFQEDQKSRTSYQDNA